jgi:serine protease inhibitor
MKLISVCLATSVAVLATFSGFAADQEKLVAANTAFAFDLMHQVAKAEPDANVFISPYSVSSALQMTAVGAAGETRIEMQRVLGTDGLAEGSLNAAFKDLDRQFNGREEVTLNLANGVWFQEGFHLKPAFVDINQKFYHAGLASVNFASPDSAQAINAWADHQTKGRIKDVVQFPFPPRTCLVLANAIYFKGTWVAPFKKNLTWPRDFHLAGGQARQTPMMAQEGSFMYQENRDFQAVKLPYKGGLQMELYLPQPGSTPQKLVERFAAKATTREAVQNEFAWREGSVTLPKFKIEYQINLNDPLQAMGMHKAFDGDADFSGAADQPLFIREVKQKSYVEVNEEGTEAAAVTTVTAAHSIARMPPPNRFTMILDRPFFFVISDINTGSILFTGIINNPVGADGS